MNKLRIVLAGNPNAGKSSVFNEITGETHEVGNWSGVSVEVLSTTIQHNDYELEIADMPGIYSLFPHSPEQICACDYLRNLFKDDNTPTVIVNIIDSSNLERNLYLSTQLLEMGLPLVIALNMTDELREKGMSIDTVAFRSFFDCPVVKIVGNRGEGIEKLLNKCIKLTEKPKPIDHERLYNRFSEDIRLEAERIEQALADKDLPPQLSRRWVAQQMLEGHWDIDIHKLLPDHDTELWEDKLSRERFRIIADIREQVLRQEKHIKKHSLTEKIDKIVCNRYLALPIFMLIMLAIFAIAFGKPGKVLMGIIGYLINDRLPMLTEGLLTSIDAPLWFISLLNDGIFAGVGSVLVFLPQLMLLFFCLALLEDSGYMARAAFITDRFLAGFGVGGKSFIPMILGFGCSVPAIMAARSIDDKKERLMTMFVTPFMSCSARVPVYLVIVGAFFSANQGLIIFLLYLTGILLAFATLLLLNLIFRGKHADRTPFVLEMPHYRRPVWHCIWSRTWVRSWDFISQAGTFILLASVVVWLLSHFNWHFDFVNQTDDNILKSIGMAIAPFFRPLGFGEWQSSVSILTGIFSKESVAATMSVLYGSELSTVLPALLSPAAALSMAFFVLLYTPCVATLATLKRESGSVLYMLGSVFYQIAVAWLVSFGVYHLALLIM